MVVSGKSSPVVSKQCREFLELIRYDDTKSKESGRQEISSIFTEQTLYLEDAA